MLSSFACVLVSGFSGCSLLGHRFYSLLVTSCPYRFRQTCFLHQKVRLQWKKSEFMRHIVQDLMLCMFTRQLHFLWVRDKLLLCQRCFCLFFSLHIGFFLPQLKTSVAAYCSISCNYFAIIVAGVSRKIVSTSSFGLSGFFDDNQIAEVCVSRLHQGLRGCTVDGLWT